jgi:hypothetical protein
MPPQYEEQFVAFVDLLGFSEASEELDEETRNAVFELLLSLHSLRSESSFDATKVAPGHVKYRIKPEISTFSDHIVVSYPLEPIRAAGANDESSVALLVWTSFASVLASVAAQALTMGFLLRGGATIGKLHHANGMIFGRPMVEAVQIEESTAVYPRVIISNRLTSRAQWLAFGGSHVVQDEDGLYHLNYLNAMFGHVALSGGGWNSNFTLWFDRAVATIDKNLKDLEKSGRLNELAKWTWFAKKFKAALRRFDQNLLKSLEISIDTIPWR